VVPTVDIDPLTIGTGDDALDVRQCRGTAWTPARSVLWRSEHTSTHEYVNNKSTSRRSSKYGANCVGQNRTASERLPVPTVCGRNHAYRQRGPWNGRHGLCPRGSRVYLAWETPRTERVVTGTPRPARSPWSPPRDRRHERVPRRVDPPVSRRRSQAVSADCPATDARTGKCWFYAERPLHL